MKPERILHLLIGAAVVAAYFIVTPSHLWTPMSGLQPSPTITVDQADGQWQLSDMELPDAVKAISVARQGRAQPLLVAVTADSSSVITVPLFEQPEEGRTLITAAQLGGLTGVSDPDLSQALYHSQHDREWLLLEMARDLVLLSRHARPDQPSSWQVLKRLPRQHDGPVFTLGNSWIPYEDGSMGVALYYPDSRRHSLWLRWRVDDGRVLLRRAMAASSEAPPAVWATDGRNMAALSGAGDQWLMTGSMLAGREWQMVPRAAQVQGIVTGASVAVEDNDHWWLATGCAAPRRGVCLQRSDNYGESWASWRQLESS